MIDWQTALDCYNNGIITWEHALGTIYQCITTDNVRDFMRDATRNVIESRLDLPRFPTTDEGWEKIRILRIGSWTGLQRDSVEKEKKDLRRGVEILRKESSTCLS